MNQGRDRTAVHSVADLGILDPNSRLRALSEYGNAVDIDFNIPPRRYFRSGLEMVRMANVYLEEGSLENAYILYLKFMTLFLEKIRQHPDYKSVSHTDRSINGQKLREVLPRAEKLKAKLLEQYTKDYKQYLEQKAQQEERELERRKREAEEKKKIMRPKVSDNSVDINTGDMVSPVILVPPPSTDLVSYPETLEPVKPQIQKPASLELPSAGVPTKPSFDRSSKPLSLLSPSIHSKLGLRDVIIPSKLMARFMGLAQQNTARNIETCGILAGKLEQNQLIITHLLVPKQSGTADSCTTQNEEEIFDYQDQHDLITLGWIHTHPSQTAFLSSVDMHTHCSYQRMMPEAIAVVCAPKYEQNGFFMLTPNYGLDFIANCRQTGFHPHPTDPPLFTNADHSRLDNRACIEVVDLRR